MEWARGEDRSAVKAYEKALRKHFQRILHPSDGGNQQDLKPRRKVIAEGRLQEDNQNDRRTERKHTRPALGGQGNRGEPRTSALSRYELDNINGKRDGRAVFQGEGGGDEAGKRARDGRAQESDRRDLIAMELLEESRGRTLEQQYYEQHQEVLRQNDDSAL